MREVSVPALYECPDQVNVADVVFELAGSHPHEAAFARLGPDGRWVDVDHARFARDVLGVAKGLIAAGVTPGTRVALMSHTRYEWGVIDFAVQAVRGVVVPVYETSSAEQIAWILGDSGARFAFVENAELAARLAEVRGEIPELGEPWVIEAGALDTVAALGADVPDERVAQLRAATPADDDATIVYTSGSTGRPKGCRLTHRNLVSNAKNSVEYLHRMLVPGSSTLLFLPLAHVFARIIQLAGFTARVRIGHQPDVSQLMTSLVEFRPSFLLAVPRVFEKVYNSAEQKAHAEGKGRIFALAARTAIAWSRGKSDGHIPLRVRLLHGVLDRLVGARLRAALGGRCTSCVSGGAPLGERLGHFFRGIGVEVFEGYGMTETSPVSAVNREGENTIGTVGRPLPGVSLRLADDGELLVRGPHVFKGYWNNPAETDAVLQDGWLRTGDLAGLDDEGYLSITGRKKEIIVTAGGKNVAPAVLEDRLRSHPLISQCVVVGDQRPYIGALVTLDADMLPGWLEEHGVRRDLSIAEAASNPVVLEGVQRAVDAANKAVSRAESIRRFVVLDTDFTEEGGQLTPSMKLKRRVVLDEFADRVDELYAGAKAPA
ncbi:AMP-dependent synthetase/ligase [Cumulibacter manganitolerans]|uniref:AMP-dependent synthetase/ligase n=1 Tax=Cumulibacter manganitolerans TaxID=1884992 RepID=UPI00129704C9|nr:AMP-dependent synthetase/ligase [Cumulibacter manganitolerans]